MRYFPRGVHKLSDKNCIKSRISGNTTSDNAFFDLKGIGNCTICKISIVVLILTSFIVVRPQKQGKYEKSRISESSTVIKKDTVGYGNLLNFFLRL